MITKEMLSTLEDGMRVCPEELMLRPLSVESAKIIFSFAGMARAAMPDLVAEVRRLQRIERAAFDYYNASRFVKKQRRIQLANALNGVEASDE